MAKKVNNEKKTVKENKQNKHYFKDMKAELKKVVWPTPKQLANNTAAVIAFTLIIAIIVFILDICFDSLNKYGITTLQEKVQSAFTTSNETEDSNNVSVDENTSVDTNTDNVEVTENSENDSVEDQEQTTTDENEANE